MADPPAWTANGTRSGIRPSQLSTFGWHATKLNQGSKELSWGEEEMVTTLQKIQYHSVDRSSSSRILPASELP